MAASITSFQLIIIDVHQRLDQQQHLHLHFVIILPLLLYSAVYNNIIPIGRYIII